MARCTVLPEPYAVASQPGCRRAARIGFTLPPCRCALVADMANVKCGSCSVRCRPCDRRGSPDLRRRQNFLITIVWNIATGITLYRCAARLTTCGRGVGRPSSRSTSSPTNQASNRNERTGGRRSSRTSKESEPAVQLTRLSRLRRQSPEASLRAPWMNKFRPHGEAASLMRCGRRRW